MRSTARPSTGMHTTIPLSGANAVGIGRALLARHRPAAEGRITCRMHHLERP